MKLTKQKLREIIKEELEATINEQAEPPTDPIVIQILDLLGNIGSHVTTAELEHIQIILTSKIAEVNRPQ